MVTYQETNDFPFKSNETVRDSQSYFSQCRKLVQRLERGWGIIEKAKAEGQPKSKIAYLEQHWINLLHQYERDYDCALALLRKEAAK